MDKIIHCNWQVSWNNTILHFTVYGYYNIESILLFVKFKVQNDRMVVSHDCCFFILFNYTWSSTLHGCVLAWLWCLVLETPRLHISAIWYSVTCIRKLHNAQKNKLQNFYYFSLKFSLNIPAVPRDIYYFQACHIWSYWLYLRKLTSVYFCNIVQILHISKEIKYLLDNYMNFSLWLLFPLVQHIQLHTIVNTLPLHSVLLRTIISIIISK